MLSNETIRNFHAFSIRREFKNHYALYHRRVGLLALFYQSACIPLLAKMSQQMVATSF
jgi:hypothetical protein